MTHSGVIDVAADRQTATARWEIQEIARTPDGSQSYDNVANYYDRLVRTPECPGARGRESACRRCQVSELIPGRCQITRQARPSGEVATCG